MNTAALFATKNDRLLFVQRAAFALVMFRHGAQHALGWFGGYSFAGTHGWMTGTLGIPAPVAALAIVTELVAPLFLLAGLGGRSCGEARPLAARAPDGPSPWGLTPESATAWASSGIGSARSRRVNVGTSLLFVGQVVGFPRTAFGGASRAGEPSSLGDTATSMDMLVLRALRAAWCERSSFNRVMPVATVGRGVR